VWMYSCLRRANPNDQRIARQANAAGAGWAGI
jgi:hypothetical protein